MFKINEAAAMLGVDKIIIYEKLIHNSVELESLTHKTNGITFIHPEGIEVIRHLIYRNGKHLHSVHQTGQLMQTSDETQGTEDWVHRPQWIIDKSEIAKRVKMFSPSAESPVSLSKAVEKALLTKTKDLPEAEEPAEFEKRLESAEPRFHVESSNAFGKQVEEIKVILNEKHRLRQEISQLRGDLVSLDSEIKRKDDALIGYHKLMKEDLEWLWDIESKLVRHIAEEEHSSTTSSADIENKSLLGRFLGG